MVPEAAAYTACAFDSTPISTLDRYSFRQAEFEAQHYLPYFNKMRVIALHAATVLSFPTEGHVVPFYLQPTIGGNDNLRGFPRYRFYDDHAVFVSVEHRWHAFTGLDMAIFLDAGKVIDRRPTSTSRTSK